MTSENTNRRLQPLGSSDYKITGGQPDIRGWKVIDTAGNKIGEVDELVLDVSSRKVRYMVVDLEGNALHLDPRSILIPIGLALLQQDTKEVIIPDINGDQLSSLPDYEAIQLNSEIEEVISAILGRAATIDVAAAPLPNLGMDSPLRQSSADTGPNDHGLSEIKEAGDRSPAEEGSGMPPLSTSMDEADTPQESYQEDTAIVSESPYTLETNNQYREEDVQEDASVPVNRTQLEVEEELKSTMDRSEAENANRHDTDPTEDASGKSNRSKDTPDKNIY